MPLGVSPGLALHPGSGFTLSGPYSHARDVALFRAKSGLICTIEMTFMRRVSSVASNLQWQAQPNASCAALALFNLSVLYVLPVVNVLRIAGLTTNIAPTDIQRARLLFSAAQAILNDCNQKMKRPHRCSPLYRSIAIRQEEIRCKIWTYLHLYRLILIFRIF